LLCGALRPARDRLAELIGRIVARVFWAAPIWPPVSRLLAALVAIAALRAGLGWALETSGQATSRRVRGRLRRRALKQVFRARPAASATCARAKWRRR